MLTDEQRKAICVRYQSGASAIVVGKEFGVGHATVLRVVKRAGIERRPVGRYEKDHSERRCSRCKSVKAIDQFPRTGREIDHGRGYICNPCVAEKQRKNLHSVVTRFDMTVEDYNHLLEHQGGVCAICSKPPLERRLVIDHDHATFQVRGLLCKSCNLRVIGLEDNEWISKAQAYLATPCIVDAKLTRWWQDYATSGRQHAANQSRNRLHD